MKQLIFILTLFIGPAAFSQSLQPQVIANGGASYSNASGQLDWTIGEPVTATLSSGNMISQGFHQPDLSISTGMVMNELDGISIYPNPTLSAVQVQFEKPGKNTRLELYTNNGKLIYSAIVTGNSTIPMDTQAAGTYLLSVIENNKKIRTAQIIKN